jgi:type IV secretory pathway VirD2 relaxase
LRRQARGSLVRAQPWRDGGAELRAYTRRSVVKASFSRNRKSGAWTAHARYLSRPGAQQELAKGLGFDATSEGIDLQAPVRHWEKSDKLMWRFIVSPEDANRLNLRDHVRELVGQMERDLGTRLEWVAIDHHNTDDAHVHLLVRGVREDGRPLEIDREYLRSGIRTRSQEIVTRELGPRLEPEMLHARGRVIRREQWTEIDRALQGKADANRIVNYEQFQPRSEAARVRAQQEIDRLQFLLGQGLARRIDERSWQLAEDHERQLRDRQRSIDVIKSRNHGRPREIDGGLERVRERERERNG